MQIGRSAYRILCFGLIFWSVNSFAQQSRYYSKPEKTFQEALKLFQKEKYGASKELFLNYINQTDNSLKSATAEYYVAISSLYLEQPSAENQIKNFAENNSEHPKAPFAYFELGNYYYAQKKYDKSINAFEEVDSDLLTLEQKKRDAFQIGIRIFQ